MLAGWLACWLVVGWSVSIGRPVSIDNYLYMFINTRPLPPTTGLPTVQSQTISRKTGSQARQTLIKLRKRLMNKTKSLHVYCLLVVLYIRYYTLYGLEDSSVSKDILLLSTESLKEKNKKIKKKKIHAC